MKNARTIVVMFVFAAAMLFALQGCEFLDKITGKTKPAEEGTTPGETTEPAPTDGGGTTPPPEEQPLAKITNIADKATGIDTKVPVELWVDPNAGKVTMVGINIFECDADWNPMPQAVVALINMSDAAICDARSWTLFEKDVDKNFMFFGNLQGMKELKPNSKYCMNYVITAEKGNCTVQVHFQTK